MDIGNLISPVKNKLGQKWPFIILRISSYIVLAAIMINISWYAWPDLVKDFGIEVYIPWRITEGDVLYRDINYYQYGPLSFYWDAMWFFLFGTSVNTLILINLMLLIFLVYLLEEWLTALSDRFTAMIGVLFFLAVFAFGKYVGISNYNYLTPYSQGATHGLILTLTMLVCLEKWKKTKRFTWLLAAGLSLGLTSLTKIEISFAAMATAGSYFAAALITEKGHRKYFIKNLGILAAISAIPPLTSLLLFSRAMPLNQAFNGVFNQWEALRDGRIAETSKSLYYQRSTGLNDITGNLLKLGKWSWIFINFVLTGLFLSLTLSRIRNRRLILSALIAGLTFSALYFSVQFPDWFEAVRPLLFIVVSCFIGLCWLIIKKTKDLSLKEDYPFYLASIVFAGMFLLKMGLNTRIYNYGFVLAMPAALLTVVILVSWIPKYLNRYGSGLIFKVMAISLIAVVSIKYAERSYSLYENGKFMCCSVSQKSDVIRTNNFQGPVVNKALEELKKRLKPGQTLAVFPEGVIFNYILRHRNPTPYIHFVPTILINNKEQDIIDSFAKNPADYIVLMHVNTSEFGFPFFGKDYGRDLYAWLNKNYRIVWREGGIPLQAGTDFGVAIAEHLNKNKTK